MYTVDMGRARLGVAVRWASAGTTALMLVSGCTFAWEDLDPRLGGGGNDASVGTTTSAGGAGGAPTVGAGDGGYGGVTIGGMGGIGGQPAGVGGGVVVSDYELIANADFASGLNDWSVDNNPVGGEDTTSTWEVLGATCHSEGSSGPCARVLYQDVTIPSTVVDAQISLRFAQKLPPGEELDPQNVTQIEKDPYDMSAMGGAQNAFRVDIVDPAEDVFSAAILLEVYAPTADVGDIDNLQAVSPQPGGLLAVVQAHAGGTLRLRIAHVESTFPWPLQLDDVSFLVTGSL
jgi:hypothetical protein